MRTRPVSIAVILIALVVGGLLGVLFERSIGLESVLFALGMEDLLKAEKEPRTGVAGIPSEYQGELQLFILAGQSNMAGYGDLPESASAPDPRVYVFGNDYRWKLATDPVDDPFNQVDRVSEDIDAGFGPSLSFASAILENHPDMLIGLVPCAKGNTTIYEWQRNLSDDSLYGSCLKRTRAASNMGEVAGLLFFQGEADALDARRHRERTLLPDQWGEHFSVFVSDWRADLGMPELPVIFAQIGTTTRSDIYPNWAIVQLQQEQVQLPFVEMISTRDLTLQDEVHFSTEAYRSIGRRLAEGYLAILEGHEE
ncbi:MAG: sialate O-acetylesterase [Chloroflexota bacterium]